jgi:hypothetical protein
MRTSGEKRCDRRAAARERSSLMTSDGHEQPRDHAIELGVAVGEAREVALVDDRGGEARLGEYHHPGGRLDQVRAGARANHQEERVLDLAVQPDDAGQPAEDFALTALAQHRQVVAARASAAADRNDRAHAWAPPMEAGPAATFAA